MLDHIKTEGELDLLLLFFKLLNTETLPTFYKIRYDDSTHRISIENQTLSTNEPFQLAYYKLNKDSPKSAYYKAKLEIYKQFVNREYEALDQTIDNPKLNAISIDNEAMSLLSLCTYRDILYRLSNFIESDLELLKSENVTPRHYDIIKTIINLKIGYSVRVLKSKLKNKKYLRDLNYMIIMLYLEKGCHKNKFVRLYLKFKTIAKFKLNESFNLYSSCYKLPILRFGKTVGEYLEKA